MIASDNSIRDPRHLQEIERAIAGPESELIVKFVEHARRDHKAEGEQRKRIEEGSDEIARPFFKTAIYIQKRFKGQIDHIAKPASDADKREYRREWEEFQSRKGIPDKHSIQLLPGNDVCTQAVFDELNVQTIEDFLDFADQKPEIMDIFSELKPLHEVAKRWRTFMKPKLRLVNGEPQ